MNRTDLYINLLEIFGIQKNAMVESQIKRLSASGFSNQQIFNAVWYFVKKKGVKTEDFKTYGIGLILASGNMEESIAYFDKLSRTRERARLMAEQNKQAKQEIIITKRQNRKIIREEFDWNE